MGGGDLRSDDLGWCGLALQVQDVLFELLHSAGVGLVPLDMDELVFLIRGGIQKPFQFLDGLVLGEGGHGHCGGGVHADAT